METNINQIIEWEKRPFSWSQLSSFEFSKQQWFEKYILGQTENPTPELIFGKAFADSCEARKPLAPVTMLSKMEQGFKVPFNGMTLIGYADSFDDVTKRKTIEYKSGVKPWDQKRVDEHGQITMYAFMNYLENKVKPEECTFILQWIPTVKKNRDNGDFSGHDYEIDFARPIEVKTFHTKRTMMDIVTFAARIKRTIEEMKSYAQEHS